MLGFSREFTFQVYPFGAFVDDPDGAESLPRILPGGIIGRTGGADDLPGQIDNTRTNADRTAGVAGTATATASAAAATTFQATGLTLGGWHEWMYRFRFSGLTVQ